MTTFPIGRQRMLLNESSDEDRAAPVKRLITEHCCSVPLLDGSEGPCRYGRIGPVCHRFDYRYSDGTLLPSQYFAKPLGNSTMDIEGKARDLAPAAYREAMEHERIDYFARALVPANGSRTTDPNRYCLDEAKARMYSGKYALCLPLGKGRLLRVSPVTECFKEIAKSWRERTCDRFVVACCNRLDRRWEMLRFNPLHADGHPAPDGKLSA